MHTTADRGRRWLGHLLPLLLIATACSGEGDVSSITSGADTASDETTTTAQGGTTTLAAGDVFSNGLAASSHNYRFESTVAEGDRVITSITGVVDNDSIAAEITVGDTVVSYIRTDQGEWLTDAGGEWIEVDGEPPAAAPLALLADAGSFEETSTAQGTVTLTGTLGESAGAAAGIRFTVEITDGLITQIEYQAETEGGTAIVTTTFTEIGTAGEVTPPEV